MLNLTREEVLNLYTYNPDTGELKRSCGTVKGQYTAKNNYIRVRYRGKSCAAHKLIWFYMTGSWPDRDIDHIDHDRSNNRWSNLRLVSRTENMRNASLSKANKSGFTGVSWCKQQNQWHAQVMVNGKSIKLGRFDKLGDAIEARKAANVKYNFHPKHGEKASA